MSWTLRAPVHRGGRSARRAIALSVAAALVAALACGCANTAPSVPAADATYGAPIEINTPQGLRAKQTIDMLNSDWPIGTVGVRTMAAPEQVNGVTTAMGNLWLDRPITVAGIDIGAGQATLHVLTSYNVAQDIELRTNDDGLVDRFDVSLQPPVIKSWRDIDTELTKSGARYSYQVSKVVQDGPAGKCVPIAGTNTDLSLPLASIFKLYVLLAVADAVKAGTSGLERPAHDHRRGQGGRIGQSRQAAGRAPGVGAQGGAGDDLRQRQHGHRPADRPAAPGAVERALVTAGHHDPASMTPFPTMHELFSIGWGEPDLREQWKQATPEARAAAVAADEFPSVPT